jgi:hypothetical protein
MTAAGDEISSVTGSFFHSDLVLGNYLLLESQRTIGTVIYIKEAPGISSRGNKSDLTSEDFSSILRDVLCGQVIRKPMHIQFQNSHPY